MPIEAPDHLRLGADAACPSCDLLGGPVAAIINDVIATDGDVTRLTVYRPAPSAAMLEAYRSIAAEWPAVKSAAVKRATASASPSPRGRRR